MIAIPTSLDEIIGNLKKLKDDDPADSHRASLDAAKKQDIVKQDIVTMAIQTNLQQGEAVVREELVTLTATIEANLRQGDLETEMDGPKGSEWEKCRIIDFF